MMTYEEARALVSTLDSKSLETLMSAITAEECNRSNKERERAEQEWMSLSEDERARITEEKRQRVIEKRREREARTYQRKQGEKKANTEKLKSYFGKDYKKSMLEKFEQYEDKDWNDLNDEQQDFVKECREALKK
jgi:hypothetical protein